MQHTSHTKSIDSSINVVAAAKHINRQHNLSIALNIYVSIELLIKALQFLRLLEPVTPTDRINALIPELVKRSRTLLLFSTEAKKKIKRSADRESWAYQMKTIW